MRSKTDHVKEKENEICLQREKTVSCLEHEQTGSCKN